ncbi:reprolysin-like metallopeptidase [Lewinella sp. LCG006]|uniref:reprolysin-like metallopeptidase n=1 Tax=Lewinella sp. LCG006 TaxID=3231911 RepID=UPI00345F9F09
MKNITSFYSICCFILFFSLSNLSAQSSIWQTTTPDQLSSAEERRITPNRYRVYLADTTALKDLLRSAAHERDVNPRQSPHQITLPTPNGEWETFQFVAYDLLHPQLQQVWSYIKTWRGVSASNPNTTIRLDWTARGFHAMVLERGNTWFVDPYYWNQRDYYQVYFKRHYPQPTEVFECHTDSDRELVPEDHAAIRAGDCKFRQYRLALACTGEYADFHGETVSGAASAMATSMNRVNGVYEADLAIRLVLVANNNDLIYLDAATDPYTNGNGSTMLGENQANCDAVIGTANYDIGHVFSTGGGGVASLNSPCTFDFKARGVTGRGAPVGDPFDIDYVAHEMGHQFGDNHTQNNPCFRSSASMEPGSASTIMGYAGICSPNVQSNSDPYYHAINIQEIANYMETGFGNSCATIIDMSNSAPNVVAGQDYDIPGGTPFVLTGSATDPNGDPITYCWEQYDNEVGEAMPPLSTNTQGPMFRSFDPVAEPTRYFPRLSDLRNNVDPTWETLPETTRDMDFRLTVRDFDGNYGCTTEDLITLSVDGSAGPFLVTNPNTNITWFEAAQATVNWDVAGTNSAPISCSNVDILLSYDGGNTYPTTLAINTPNDGSQTINVPAGTTNTARVMVRCSGNVFFDISNTNFTIDAATAPNYTFTYNGASVSECQESTATLNFVINTSAIAGYNDPLILSAISVPVGVSVDYSANPINPGDNVTVSVDNFDALSPGNYIVTIQSASTAGNKTVDLPFTILPLAAAPALISPADGTTDQSIFNSLSWNAGANTNNYFVELATDPSFNTIVYSTTTSSTSVELPEVLIGGTIHYWRVTGNNNNCGRGFSSPTRSFETEPCYYYENKDFLFISNGPPADYSSTIDITNGGDITDLDLLNLDISHTWVEDLELSLTAPGGTNRLLFSYDCGSSDNVLLSFDDEAAGLPTCPYNTGAKVRPEQSFTAFDNLSLNGSWKLNIRDNANQDGGSLNNWGLKICTDNFSVLPVTWLSFTAKAETEAIHLQWETTQEEDNAGFDLERRSAYETAFRPVAWIPATDAPAITNRYAHVDKDVQPGLTYYYRLRQIDYSGKESYSEMRSAAIATTTPQWTLFPNPTAGNLQVQCWNTNQLVTLKLINIQGKTLQEWVIDAENVSSLDLNNYPAGVYWLKASTQDWEATERVVKI